MTISDDVRARADELMQHAPGRVSVRRISHIDDVQLLRTARTALTDDENQMLRDVRLELMERLDGAVAPTTPPRPEEKKGMLGALMRAIKGMSIGIRSQGDLAHLASEPTKLARLPAPTELLDAAEAWLIAQLVADRVDGDLSVLRNPWDQATIEPVEASR